MKSESMLTGGTNMSYSDFFRFQINTMAAAREFCEQQRVWCVLTMEQGKTFVQVELQN